MDEVTSTDTETSSQEVPNAECPLSQYVTKVEKPPGAYVKKGETYTLSATIVA